jgi:hypothetical protein
MFRGSLPKRARRRPGQDFSFHGSRAESVVLSLWSRLFGKCESGGQSDGVESQTGDNDANNFLHGGFFSASPLLSSTLR